MKEQILELREKGYTYNQIVEELGCSKSTVSYHCGQGQKEKTLNRKRIRREDKVISKTEEFKYNFKGINNKYTKFRGEGDGTHDFTYEDVRTKLLEDPTCYLTGRALDLEDPSSYHFDHKIPVSLDGLNTLENLGFSCKEANMAKSNLLLDDLLDLCFDILKHNNDPRVM
jgi:DNA-binding CsgD family transcriptional regulator